MAQAGLCPRSSRLPWTCLALGLGVVVSLAGCARTSEEVRQRPLVAVSVEPLAFFVDRLAGDSVEVAVMIPPGANHHSWEPRIEQVQAAAQAAIYVAVGHPHLPLEATSLERLLEGNRGVLRVACGATAELLDEDPHLWTSPRAVVGFVAALAEALRQVLPREEAAIRQREAALRAEIEGLDAELRQILQPYRGRRFYVFHPAWGYLAHEFGLLQVAMEHDGKEPGPADLARLVRQAKADGVTAIFTQPQYSERSAQLVAEEIGARVVSIDPLSRDWPAALRQAARAIADSLGDRLH